ncbi:MAG: 4Fe-4S binding protein [Firmicutes bacterium]|nr:4Fe-4S binding protein [Bacillota bacterium]
MKRRIIKIDESKCNGCGLCAAACHEGAIGMVDGVAKLLRDDYCDGLGDCLPACPMNAISFEEREALPYDEAAVKAAMAERAKLAEIAKRAEEAAAEVRQNPTLGCGCPGSMAKAIVREETCDCGGQDVETAPQAVAKPQSQLQQWPVQIKLVPTNAPYFDGAKLLVAADCTAYAYANFHEDFIKGRITLVGCPKLDMVDYAEKLTEIIANNDIKDVTVVRMEVPCCGGIEMAVKRALQASGKFIPWQIITVSSDGEIVE